MIFSHKKNHHNHHLQHLDLEEGWANDLSWKDDHQEGPKDVIGTDT